MKVCKVAGLLGVMVAVSVASAEVRPDISDGSKALLFSFSGLQNLGAGAYKGGIGVKYYLMNPIAARGTLIFGRAAQSIPATSDTVGEDGSASALMLGLSLGAEYHLTFERVSPYIGGDVGFSMTRTKNESAINVAGGTRTTIKNSANGELNYFAGTSLTFNGLAGVEFFITDELSLGAEYLLGYSLYLRSDMETKVGSADPVVQRVPNGSYFGISNGGALTLAVYF